MSKPDETRNFYEELTKRTEQRERLERDTTIFVACGGRITKIPMGVSAMNNGTPVKLMQSYSIAGKRGARANNVLLGNRV